MTTQQFRAAFQAYERGDLTMDNLHIFDGFGLPDFEPVTCRIEDVAGLIAWQCSYINSDGIDVDALNEIRKFGRKRFLIAN